MNRRRAIPAETEGQENAETSTAAVASGTVPPPPAADNSQPSPEASSTPAGAAASPGVDNSPAAAEAKSPAGQAADQPQAPAGEIISLDLPSGKTFKSRIFKVNLNAIIDLLKDTSNEEQLLFLEDPLGRICVFTEYKKNNLDGMLVAFYPNFLPKTYATYTDGSLDGMIKTWTEQGQREYWCQYSKGLRNGFCGYFKDNKLCLLLEIDRGTVSGVHLCANRKLEKSFTSLEQASADKDAKILLEEIDNLESDLKISERSFKKGARDEYQFIRRLRIAAANPQKRGALQDHLNQHAFTIKSLINTFWLYKGW